MAYQLVEGLFQLGDATVTMPACASCTLRCSSSHISHCTPTQHIHYILCCTTARYKPRGAGDVHGGRGVPLGADAGQVVGGRVDWGHLAGADSKLYVGDFKGQYKLLEEDKPRLPPPPPHLAPGGLSLGGLPAAGLPPPPTAGLPPPPPPPAKITSVEEALAILEQAGKKGKKDKKHKKEKKGKKEKKHRKEKKEKKEKKRKKGSPSSSSSSSDSD